MAAPLSDPQQRSMLVKWGVLLVAGMAATYAMLHGMLPFPTGVTSFAGPWLLLLGVGQFITGLASQQRVEKAIGILWAILSIFFMNPTWPDTTTYWMVANITLIPYLYLAFRR
jgi:hypothetical protein